MQASENGDASPTALPGLVLLHGIDEITQGRIRVACQANAFDPVVTNRVEDGAVYAEGSRPVCVATSIRPAINARLADNADRAFRRSVVVTFVESVSEATLWRRLAWDVITPETSSGQLIEILAVAIVEADRRRRDWDLVGDYHRRRATLTPAEEDVLTAVCSGQLNKQIASELSVSIRTVEQRRRRVFSKMGVPSAIPLADLVATVRTLEGQRLRRDPSQPAPTPNANLASDSSSLKGPPLQQTNRPFKINGRSSKLPRCNGACSRF